MFEATKELMDAIEGRKRAALKILVKALLEVPLNWGTSGMQKITKKNGTVVTISWSVERPDDKSAKGAAAE